MDNYSINRMARRLVASILVLVVLLYFSTGRRIFQYSLISIFETDSMLLYTVEILLSLIIILINGHLFVSGFRSVIKGAPNTDALVSLGAITAFLYSAIISIRNINYYGNMGEYIGESDIYFETCALILTLVLAGRYFEEKAKGRTTNALRGLMDLSPKTAVLLTKDGEKEVEISCVKVGDIFVVKPGMRIPVDGVVRTGNSAVDESSLTGESIPVDKMPGKRVSAATINLSGYLTCRATKVGEDTAFSHIVRMVTDSSSGKGSVEKKSDKISKIIIPIVLLISIGVFVFWFFEGAGLGFAISRAVAVLIISCPCALSLSAPIAVMVGTGVGARCGILFKSSQALEDTGLIRTVVVDKTGTITSGEPRVTDIISTADDIEHTDLLLTVAYSIESKSEHPLAKAICRFAEKRYISALETLDFSVSPGRGVSADIVMSGKRTRVFAGNENYISDILYGKKSKDAREADFESEFLSVIYELEANGKTPIIFATQKGLLGVIAVADKIRESSYKAVQMFHREQIHVVLVTGDREATANAVAKRVGIGADEVISEVLPEDKADIVRNLSRKGKTAMIGDGINDAPALTRADVGIAIGAGTDVAVDAADVVLIHNNMLDAINAVRLSRYTGRIIKQNIIWTILYNIVGIPFAAGVLYKSLGILWNPVFCSLTMSISGLIVVINSLKLYNFMPIEAEETVEND